MKALRTAAILACAMGAALAARAADRTGPAPSDVIYPRVSDPAAGAAAPAQDGSATQALAPLPAMGGVGPAAGYVIALVLLAGGAIYLLKRGSLPRPFSKSEGRLKVLETRMLGNRQFLVVVEYDDAKMLLGVCQGRIEYLTPLAGHPLAPGADNDEETPATRVFAATAGEQSR